MHLQRARGTFFILCSALLFYLATFFVRLASERYTIPGSWYTLSRFALGLPLFWFFFRRARVEVNNRTWLFVRAVCNVVAVVFFLYAAHFGSVMNANILNMTYPAFVALLSPVFIGEKNSWTSWVSVVAAITGATLITLGGKELQLKTPDLLGLASGITAGVGVMSLRQIRKTDSTFNVLYYTFLLGTLASLLLVILESFVWVQPATGLTQPGFWQLLLLSGLCGVLGQWVFTYGFAWVGAVEGSILSSTRILIALAFGVLWFGEAFTAAAALGAGLVLFSNVLLSLRRT
ncbi:MAG: DMT family transporter [Spirochaetota bacterium]